jgi:hypothetical protein
MTSPGRMQKEVERGQAPTGVDRVDSGNTNLGEKNHVHFDDGSALNSDGTWKHGESTLTNDQKDWLRQHGWTIPAGQ